MSVSILVVYTGEEMIRNWLQTKVKERQLYIRNDPSELEAAMKTVDIGRKNFDLISTSGSGTHDVINISFVQGWFRSHVLGEFPLKENVFNVRTNSARRTRVWVGGLQDQSFVEKMRQC